MILSLFSDEKKKKRRGRGGRGVGDEEDQWKERVRTGLTEQKPNQRKGLYKRDGEKFETEKKGFESSDLKMYVCM